MKDKTVAGLLALFLGGLGAHKFYLGKPIWGLLYLCFSWTFVPSFIALIEGLDYLLSSQSRFDSMYNKNVIMQHSSSLNPTEELEKLAGLMEKGLISKAEYDKRKSQIL